MSTQTRPAPTEHVPLVASPERALTGWGERNLLAPSFEGPDRRRKVHPERRNERMALMGRRIR
jgi:hypothetical protein